VINLWEFLPRCPSVTTMGNAAADQLKDAVGLLHVGSQATCGFSSDDPLELFTTHIAQHLVELTNCDAQVAHKSISWAPDFSHLLVVGPRLKVKALSADALTEDLQQRFPQSPYFGHPVPDGKNLMFFFVDAALARLLIPHILNRKSRFGMNRDGAGKKVIVEFSSPNIGKSFDGLHLRSTFTGAFIANLYEIFGWSVHRMNFLGDWGRHIGLLLAGWPQHGAEAMLGAEPLHHLLHVFAETDKASREEDNYIRATQDEQCRKLEDRDAKSLALWQRLRDCSIQEHATRYSQLGLTFDEYSGESQITQDTMNEVMNRLRASEYIAEKDDGEYLLFGRLNEKGLKDVKIRSIDATSSYLLRDIAAAIERDRMHHFDKMIYVVAARQSSHFRQVFKALEIMGFAELASKLQHVSFEEVHGLEAKRDAIGILLADILDQARDAASHALVSEDNQQLLGEQSTEQAESVGVANLAVEQLSHKRNSVIKDVFRSTQGQYLHKRHSLLSSMLPTVTLNCSTLDYTLFENEDEAVYADTLKMLLQWPSTLKTAFEQLESFHIVTYLTNLVASLDGIWETQAEGPQDPTKLALLKCVQHTLESGLNLLGLELPAI
jgi:arginyl-tRNA synthetase